VSQRRIADFVGKLLGRPEPDTECEQSRQADEAVAAYEQRCDELRLLVLESEQLRDEFEELFAQSQQAAEDVHTRREQCSDSALVARLNSEEAALREESSRLGVQLHEQLKQLATLQAQYLESTSKLEFLRNEQTILKSRLEVARSKIAVLHPGSAQWRTNSQRSIKLAVTVSAIAVLSLVAVVAVLKRPSNSAPATSSVITNSIGMKFVRIPAGQFVMGSPRNERGRFPNEHMHPVRITRPFLMGIHEVTVGQFREFVDTTGHNSDAEKDEQGGQGIDPSKQLIYATRFDWRSPGYEQTESHPVVNVTWRDATAFVQWLSLKESVAYRLPTEAEWEYACRAGMQTAFQSGPSAPSLTRVANVGDLTLRDARMAFRKLHDKDFIQSRDHCLFPAEVGNFEPNSFGLFDMIGNVCEWCSDWHQDGFYQVSPVNDPQGPTDGKMRVFRGGSWTAIARFCRSSNRARYEPAFRANYIGFRIVREVGSPLSAE
jgi:formylglycine-generating enzyme required for sulfatase activity